MMLQAEQQKFQAETQADQQKHQATQQAAQQAAQQKMAFDASEAEKDRIAELEKTKMVEATKLAIAQLNAEVQDQALQKSQSFEAQKLGATFEREDRKEMIPEREVLQEREGQMGELLANLQQAIMAMAESLNRPKSVIRNPADGKIIGVQ
jgi:hypothetical protein